MKNTTKKILSMLLVVIMLLSVMPVAYAAPENYPPEAEEYIDLFCNFFACINHNVYFSDEKNEYYDNLSMEIPDDKMEPFWLLIEEWFGCFDKYGKDAYFLLDYYEDCLYNHLDDEEFLKSIRICNDYLKALLDIIEEFIEAENLICIIDISELFKASVFPVEYYGIEALQNLGKSKTFMNEYNQTIPAIDDEYRAYLYNTPKEEMNQGDFDAIWKKGLPLLKKSCNCLEGVHNYGEYISNYDATEETDGTKTATCELCGATDTVINEGSKLVKEPASFFEMLIALIKEFFAKILSIFG